MEIDLPNNISEKIYAACEKAGLAEIGGVLFGEQVEPGKFKVVDITIAERGLAASFKRSLRHVFQYCERFFQRTNHDYSRFNYLGEWHSHPSYALQPSSRDNASMLEIVCDPSVGANFAVLMIVKIETAELKVGGWAFFPDSSRVDVDVIRTTSNF